MQELTVGSRQARIMPLPASRNGGRPIRRHAVKAARGTSIVLCGMFFLDHLANEDMPARRERTRAGR